jgi:hypothetical protein
MRTLLSVLLAFAWAAPALAETPDPPLDNPRIAVHTLVREDIFAGWRSKNMERFERGERNIDLLLESRPRFRADLLAWKGGAKLYRAVLALEAGDEEQFKQLFAEAQTHFAEAEQLGKGSLGVTSVVGGAYLTFGDRLPEEHRADAWQKAYDSYSRLWTFQGKIVERLPEHLQGELLAGLVQSAQRTGRQAEYEEYLDKIIAVMPGTAYARVATHWKANPEAAATGNISCKSCHNEGRLESRLEALQAKK